MNSGLRRRAFMLSALLVSRIGTHIRRPGFDPLELGRSFCPEGAARVGLGTRFGLLTYLIAIVTGPLIHAGLGRNEAAEILNRAAVAGSQQ
jgi:hypothetical protein